MNFAQFISLYFSELWMIDGFKRVSRSTFFDGTQYTVTGEFDINPGLTLKDVATLIHKRLYDFQSKGNNRIDNAIGRITYKGRRLVDWYRDDRGVAVEEHPKKYEFTWSVYNQSFFSSKPNDGNTDYFTTNLASMVIRVIGKKQTPEGVVFSMRIVGQMLVSTLCRDGDDEYSDGVRF